MKRPGRVEPAGRERDGQPAAFGDLGEDRRRDDGQPDQRPPRADPRSPVSNTTARSDKKVY